MTIKSKLKTFFFLDEQFDDENNEFVEEKKEPIVKQSPIVKQQSKQPIKPQQNVVSIQSVHKQAAQGAQISSAKVVLVEPRSYSEATEIADQLKNRRAVVVNLQRIDKEQGRQIVDFLSGTVYALGGDIQKIGLDIFFCTPDNVEVTGNISELIGDQDGLDSRW
jgi:cell division inhibitor SepF